MSNNLNWTVAYKTVFGEKKVESFKDKKEATARYEALLARTYGSLGDIAGVTKPVQSGAKVTESKEQKTPKKCESWVVDYKRLFDSEIESEEFDNLTDANEFYNRLMDDAEGYEFIDEPREVEGLEECGGASAASLGAIPTGVVRQNDEAKKNENLTDKEEHEWYRFWFDDVKKHIVPGKSGSVEHNCKMLPYSDVRQMWGVAAMAKELCDNFRRYLSYQGYTNSKGSPFAQISWRAEDAEDLLTAMNKADGTPIESKKSEADGDEAKLQAAYGDGGIITNESSADGFYVDDHDPMGYAILNNDVATMKELFNGGASVPEKPWTYAGWHEDTDAPEDKDGNYPYVYDWDREYQLNFVNDWKRVVGETNNEEALNLLLEKAPDFVPTAIDFYNAFHAGYDKKLLRKLLNNISTVVDEEDISSEYLNYEDFGEDAYNNLDKFLDASDMGI